MRKLSLKTLQFLWPLAITCSLGLLACSEDLARGPGSETTNGRIEKDGSPASFARVTLREVDHRAFSARSDSESAVVDTYADADGNFQLKVPKEGDFRVMITHNGNAFTKVVNESNKESLESVALEPMAVMKGELDIPTGSEMVWVGILGTDILVPTDVNGVFVLPSVPANDSLRLYFVNEAFDSLLQTKSVYFEPTEFAYENYKTVVPADTTELDTAENDKKDSLSLPREIVLKTDDGKIVSYASVALRKKDYSVEKFSLQNSLVIADLLSDGDGMVAVEVPDTNSYRLTVVWESYSHSDIYDSVSLSEIDTLVLERSSTVSSKVTLNDGEEFAWVGIYGMDVLVKTDAQGAYVLPGLPAGQDLDLYFVHADGSEPFTQRTIKTPAEGTAYLSVKTLLYDFEELDSLWYMSVDTLWKGSTFKLSNGKNDSTHLLKDHLEWDEERNSQVFHAKYTVAKDPYAWVLVGTGMSETRNFALVDSVSFYAKGDGQIRLSLENWESYVDNAKAASVWMDLSSEWQRFVVKPTDLCFNNANLWNCEKAWNSVKDQVKQIHLFPNMGSEFFIDDVVLYGAHF